MGKYAEHVYTDEASIARIEALIAQLPANGRVRVVLQDGTSYEGVISARPNIQAFRDANEAEGINATLQLERPGEPQWARQLWLDEVVSVEHLDSTLGGES